MTEQRLTDSLKGAAGMSIGWAVVMIVLGVFSLMLPLVTGIGVSILVGWIVFFGGLVYLAYAFSARNVGAFLWRTLIGVVYLVGGLYLAFHPGIALASLTFLMALVFLVEGSLEIIVFFQLRSFSGSGWLLFDAIATVLLAYLIWSPWPGSSTWAVGTLLGINLIISGFTRLTYSVAAQKAVEEIA